MPLLAALLWLAGCAHAVFNGRTLKKDEENIRLAAAELYAGGKFYCSAVLVDDLVVMTAAHCVRVEGGPPRMPEVVRFVAGGRAAAVNVVALARFNPAATPGLANATTPSLGDLALVLLDQAAPGGARKAQLYGGAPRHEEAVLSGSGLAHGGSRAGLLAADMKLGRLANGDFTLSLQPPLYAGPCPGDSGGGVYMTDGGDFKLIGVNASAPTGGSCTFTGPASIASAERFRPWIVRKIEDLRAGRHGRSGDCDGETFDLLACRRAGMRNGL